MLNILRASFLLVPMALVGCDLLESGKDPAYTDTGDTGAYTNTGPGGGPGNTGGPGGTDDTGAGDDTGTAGGTDDTGTAGGTDDTGTTGGPDTPEWDASGHPCVGNRTDALFFDDADNGFVGCGSTTTGYGLYETSDGGRSWSAVSTEPNRFLEDFRVLHVTRSDDDLLYISGVHTTSDQLVLAADTSSAPYELSEVFNWGGQTWNSFTVGSFARLSDGSAVAESLNGTNIVYRDGEDGAWQDGTDWYRSYTSFGFQVLDMVVHDDGVYGCGSTISQPPMVYLPKRGGGDFGFEPVQLAEGLYEYDGEMWDLDVDDGGVIVGGVNQNTNVGMIYVSGDDPYDSGDWNEIDVGDIVGDSSPTWIRGVCRDGDTLLALGEYSTRADGLALMSEDNGESWSDITDELGSGVPPMHRCLFVDGAIHIAGADGFFASYR